MRPTVFVIVVYILFLLTQPCQDVLGARPSDGGRGSASIAADKGECEDENSCSPFCICSCRQAPAGYFSYESAIQPKILTAPSRTPEIGYVCHVPFATLNSIWQPPKH